MKHYFSILALVLFTMSVSGAETPDAILLWPEGAPGSEALAEKPEQIEGTNITQVHNPSLTPYLPSPDKATGTAVIVCPGGGHKKLCVGHEGFALCEWFRDQGIAAFLLKYRLCREEDSIYTLEGHAMDDTRRAIRVVRSRAGEWNLKPDRVGILGFSAGGELAAYSAMWPKEGNPDATDPIEKVSSRPDFQGLIYPGKSDTFTVEKGMPPVFIACGYNDRPDISKGMASLYLKYKEAGVKAELHIYSNSGHGFGYRPDANTAASRWTDRFREWLFYSKFL
ncbi:MAG: alpha/beta hydrolase [Verrucomicrobiales bacterium]|nr:alpha/beta hydrolase [Verrucomicrobiales bacterium]